MARDIKLGIRITADDKASRTLERLGTKVQHVGRFRGLDRLARSADALSGAFGNIGTTLSTRVTAPLAAIAGFSIYSAGKIEQFEVQFESLLGSSEAAKKMVKDLVDFTARTPFQLDGVAQATKQLLAQGVAAEDIQGELKVLGDIAAGTGKPLGELAQIYSKSLAKGKVQTEELNQLSEAGVPIMDALIELAAKYGNTISKDDIYESAERGEISFRALREAMGLLTEEGGVYENQMEKQSKTLFGRFSTLKDNVMLLSAEIGDQLQDTFQVKPGMEKLTEWIQGLTTDFRLFADENPEAADIILKVGAGAAIAGPALVGLSLGLKGASFLFGGLALLANPFVLTLTLLAAAAVAAWYYWDEIEARWETGTAKLRSSWDEFTAYIRGESDKSLYEVMVGPPDPERNMELFGQPEQPSAGEVTHQSFKGLIDAWDNTFAWIERNTPARLQFLNKPISFEGIDAWGWLQRQWDGLDVGALEISFPEMPDVFGWIEDQWDRLWAKLALNVRDVLGDTATDFIFGDAFGRIAAPVPAANDNAALLGAAAFRRLHLGAPVETPLSRAAGANPRDVVGRRDRMVIEVDFQNLPPATRYRTRGNLNPDVDLELNAGYAMESF